MRKNWKRILAATLAACMIFCDSSLVYAAESQPIVEASETETEVETTEIGDETTLPEATEEDVVTEESTEEVEDVEPVEETEQEEILPEEEPTEEEKEIVEIMPVTEVSSVVEMNEAVDGTTITGGESGTTLSKWYDFIPTKSGYYYLVSDTFRFNAAGVYSEETQGYIYQNNGMDFMYVLKDGETVINNAVEKVNYFETGKQYKISILGSIAANETATFVWSEYTEKDTAIVLESGQPVEVTGGQCSLYKIELTGTQAGFLSLNKYGEGIGIFGDTYYSSDASTSTESVSCFATPGGGKYYIVVSPTSDAQLQWTLAEPATFQVGSTEKITATTEAVRKCYEFVSAEDKTYLLECNSDSLGWVAIGKSGSILKSGSYKKMYDGTEYYSGDTYEDEDGTKWLKISDIQDVEKVLIFSLLKSITSSTATGNVTLQEYREGTGTQLDLDVFQDTITIPAGETVTVTYNGKHLGDYFIYPVDGVEFNSVSVGPGLEGGLEYEYSDDSVVGYGLKDEYDPETTDTATFTFELTNNTESDKDISIFNSLSNSLGTYTEGAELKLGDYENVADSEEIENVGYYRFTPTTTTLYYHNDLEWIIREGAEKNVRADKHKAANGAVILNAGETYILKFSSEEYYSEGFEGYEYGEKDNEKISYTNSYQDCLQKFYPPVTGKYYQKEYSDSVEVWEQNATSGEWELLTRCQDGDEYYYALEANKEYFVYFTEYEVFGLKNDITVLDYDYLEALIQSGGSVTVSGNKVTEIKQGTNAVFTFIDKLLSIFGVSVYEKTEVFQNADEYWNNENGAFAASEFYYLPDGSYVSPKGAGFKMSELNLTSSANNDAKNGDVVVIKYEPEIVWVDSMEVSADATLIGIGETTKIHVAGKAATEKYPLDNPIYSYVSSNPSVLTVDENGVVTAQKAGTATITVAADVAARYAEGCPEDILEKKIKITVTPKYNIIYHNVDGVEGNLTDEVPMAYYKASAMTLVEPEVNPGYEFVGWYSNEALTKKITSIPKGSTGDKNIYARWKLHDYSIDYVLDGGKFAADANQPITFTMDKATVLVNPIRQGYTLESWYWMKKDVAGELYEEELPYNTVKENPEDPESPDKKVWYIPANIKEDVQIFAKWKFDTQFSLTINGEKDEDGNITITHPYNSATGEWDYLNSSFVIQSNTEGIVPELYYNEDVNLSVTATLMKLNEDGSVFGTVASWGSDYDRYEDYEFYRVTDLIADDIKAPGKYRLEVCYTHPGQDMQYLEQEFTVNYAKREYPVNKEVSWSALSNVDSNRTYSMIASEIADKMQPDESVFITDLGERKLAFNTELVNVIFKDSKNRVVKNTAKVTSGTYTVVLEFAENDRFLTEATGTVNISYGTIASAGVQYLAAETLEDTDAEGRIPGSTIAFEIPKLDEEGNPVVDDAGESITINTTPYVNGVQIDPIVKVPWNTEAIPVAALKASLEANGYDGYTVSVGVSDASRKAFLTFSEVTSAITKEVVAYVVTGNAAGKANLVFETTIADAEGNEVAVIPTTIKNFTVVNGGVDAVESITLDLYKTEEIVDENLFKPKETDATGVKTYLIEKDEVARTYWLDVEALNYEGNSPENVKLSWKSSNSKLAAVKTAKDGTVTLTIPKNVQGVVDITVTAKDAAKNSQSIKFVIVDTSMRLDTTSLTMNSKLEGESAVAYLYPNVLASELDGIPLEDLFEDEGKIALYDRKKSGKTYIYEPSAVFDSEYNVKTGELLVTFNSEKYPAKAATHTVYVGILHEGDVVTGEDESKIVNPSEVYALKIKDTCALPKAPSLKVTKNYEVVYKEGWAELTLTLKSPVARIYDANVDDGSEEDNWTPAIQVKNTSLFEVVAWEDLSYGDGTTWKLKVRANDPSVLPAENQKSKVTKNVEFAIGYDGYRQDEDAIATTKANITAVRTLPTLYVYGEDAYAPVYYTDADYRYVDVVIPVTKELINGIVDESSKDMDGNADSSGAIISLAEDKELEIVLADAKPNSPSKFEVVDAEVRNYDFKVPGKKDSVEVEHAIAMTVMVNSSQTKNVNLQFNVRSTALEDGVTITTKALAIKPRTIKSESISLVDWNTEKSIKNLNFNSNYAGKESIEIEVMKPATLSGLSELNGFEYKSCILVEAADKNTQKMLQNNDLLVEADEYGDVFKVTSTSDSFKYKTAKLKITMVANEDTGNPLKTKSTTLTVNFKKALTPKITISNAKIIRGLNVYGKGFEHAEYWGDWVETKVKYANMPVGAEVIDVRFADQADYTKYFDPYEYIGYESVPEYLYIEARPEAKLSLGKDAIGLIYDVRTATGEVISIHATLNLTIADSFSLKTDVKSINLYNSAVGKDYGKYVTFYDTKGHAVEVLEIINEVELKNAGINFDLTATTEEELTKEHSKEVLGKDAVKFYVDGTLKRGIEKTYTVKAKVAVVDFAVKENETLTTTTATEKTLTFKIVLKK